MGATVWLPSLNGFGTKPEDLFAVTFDSWMTDAQNGLKRLQDHCDRVTVVGHSFGGLLGLLLAAKTSEISCMISWAGVFDLKDRRRAVVASMYKIPILRKLIPERVSMNLPDELIEQGWVGYSWMPVSIILPITEGINQIHSMISKVSCPTFVIQGTLDESITDKSPHKIYQSINSSLKDIWIVEGGKHPIMQDKHIKEELFKRSVHFIQKSLNDN